MVLRKFVNTIRSIGWRNLSESARQPNFQNMSTLLIKLAIVKQRSNQWMGNPDRSTTSTMICIGWQMKRSVMQSTAILLHRRYTIELLIMSTIMWGIARSRRSMAWWQPMPMMQTIDCWMRRWTVRWRLSIPTIIMGVRRPKLRMGALPSIPGMMRGGWPRPP